jgi:hypothetical protein
MRALIVGVGLHRWSGAMNTAIARHLARSYKKTVASFDNVISVAIFSGLGLLISVSVLLLDRYVPGDWF